MWYPGSGVVLDCIDSSSLPSFLLGTGHVAACSTHTTWEEGVRRSTVNPEIFARILFSRIVLKDILATVKICD